MGSIALLAIRNFDKINLQVYYKLRLIPYGKTSAAMGCLEISLNCNEAKFIWASICFCLSHLCFLCEQLLSSDNARKCEYERQKTNTYLNKLNCSSKVSLNQTWCNISKNLGWQNLKSVRQLSHPTYLHSTVTAQLFFSWYDQLMICDQLIFSWYSYGWLAVLEVSGVTLVNGTHSFHLRILGFQLQQLGL